MPLTLVAYAGSQFLTITRHSGDGLLTLRILTPDLGNITLSEIMPGRQLVGPITLCRRLPRITITRPDKLTYHWHESEPCPKLASHRRFRTGLA